MVFDVDCQSIPRFCSQDEDATGAFRRCLLAVDLRTETYKRTAAPAVDLPGTYEFRTQMSLLDHGDDVPEVRPRENDAPVADAVLLEEFDRLERESSKE